MDKEQKYRWKCGEITAFLSMIFLLIAALIGTLLESARVNVAVSCADRSMQNAMDSLYTEYCLPLWEDYHVFFLEGEETEERDKEYIRNVLYDYMSDTFLEKEREKDIKIPAMDLLEMDISGLEILDIVRADEQEGGLLLHEILEYEKYQVGEEFLTGEKKTVGTIEETNAAMTVTEKQLEAEEKMAEVNLKVIELVSVTEKLSTQRKSLLTQLGNVEKEAKQILKKLKKQEKAEEKGEEVKEISYKKIEKLEKKFVKKTEEMLEQTEAAKEILAEIKEKQPVFVEEANEFETIYAGCKEKLSDENRSAFEGEIKKLKEYASLEGSEESSLLAKVLKLEGYLDDTEYMLIEFLTIKNWWIGCSVQEAESYIKQIKEWKQQLKTNQKEEAQYSIVLETNKKKVKNPVSVFQKKYKNSILDLVVKEKGAISTKKKKIQRREAVPVLEKEIKQFNEQYDAAEWLKNGAEDQIQMLLLTYYIETHFKSYVSEKDTKESVLCYEAEYILGGELSDKENLEIVLKKIVFLRTVLNYLYLMTDTEKTDMAYAAAAALVGFLGMEPLVQLTKNTILLVWAAEEGILDAGVLLAGKEIPLFKTKENFQISFEELLSFGREQIQAKIAAMPDYLDKEAMNYQQYLRIFFHFCSKSQKLNGITELLEDNIRLRYDESFTFANCIYGVEAEAEFALREKFLRLPFVSSLLNHREEGFYIYSHQSYCYE